MDEKKITSLKEIIKGILVLAVLGYIFVWLLGIAAENIVESVIKLNKIASNFDVVIVVSLITGAVSILGVVISSIVAKIIEYRQNTKRYLYEKKEEPYSEFIEMVYKIQQSSKDNKEYSEKEMIDDILSFSKKLTLWGSSEVIKKWLTFRMISQENNGNPTENLFILEDIIFEIRKDMGQKKKGLKKGDILSFFINDINRYLSKDKKKK